MNQHQPDRIEPLRRAHPRARRLQRDERPRRAHRPRGVPQWVAAELPGQRQPAPRGRNAAGTDPDRRACLRTGPTRQAVQLHRARDAPPARTSRVAHRPRSRRHPLLPLLRERRFPLLSQNDLRRGHAHRPNMPQRRRRTLASRLRPTARRYQPAAVLPAGGAVERTLGIIHSASYLLGSTT